MENRQYTIDYTETARSSITAIVRYLIEEWDNIEYAEGLFYEVNHILSVILTFPYSGRKVSTRISLERKYPYEIRYFPVKKYIIFYCVREDVVTFLLVRHAKQDFYGLF